ncbi:MAG TPA: penicillin acylase family protein, partial [Streptosporangiaceae bacterium]
MRLRGHIQVSRAAALGSAVVAAAAMVTPVVTTAAANAGVREAGQRVGYGTAAAVIHRDRYGVPSVYSPTLAGMWFGAGWAQAQDRMAQLELTRRAVEGTLSQLFGPSELGQDETVRTFFYTPAELRAQFRSLPAATRSAITQFSRGINAYEKFAFTSANPQQRVPVEFFVIGKALGLAGPYQPAPWRPIDTVAVGNYLAREFGGGGGGELQNLSFLTYLNAELTAKGDAHPARDASAIFNDARWINDTTAPTTVPPAHPAAVAAPAASAATRATARQYTL